MLVESGNKESMCMFVCVGGRKVKERRMLDEEGVSCLRKLADVCQVGVVEDGADPL